MRVGLSRNRTSIRASPPTISSITTWFSRVTEIQVADAGANQPIRWVARGTVVQHGLIPWQRASTTEFEEVSASAAEGQRRYVRGRSPHRPGIWDFCELATSSFLLTHVRCSVPRHGPRVVLDRVHRQVALPRVRQSRKKGVAVGGTGVGCCRSRVVNTHVPAGEFSMSRRASTPGYETILVVDDDEAVRQSFARMLKLEGYRVRTAMNAERGLWEVAQSQPDAIILDLRMPLVDGLGFLRRLRRATVTARRRWRSSLATTSSMTPCRRN